MITEEMFEQMKTELGDCVAQLRSAMDEMQASCCHAVHTFREEIERMTKPAPAGGKLYTAFDVIRMVQAAVSDEICGLSASEVAIAYEVERAVVEKIVKEGEA